jgi:hypothetical protein
MYITIVSFTYIVLVDDDSRMKNITWINDSSKMQYNFFGDVICMTCRLLACLFEKRNFTALRHVCWRQQPLQSIILGNVLLRDEQTIFFEWVTEFIRMTSDETRKTIRICCFFFVMHDLICETTM